MERWSLDSISKFIGIGANSSGMLELGSTKGGTENHPTFSTTVACSARLENENAATPRNSQHTVL